MDDPELARAAAARMWPKTRSTPRAASAGFGCCVARARRSRADWTAMTDWRELFERSECWPGCRIFAEFELAVVGGVRQTQDVLVVARGALTLWTIRASDLEVGTLSFVKAEDERGVLRTCMLLDVRPIVVDARSEGFAYLFLFEHDAEAGVLFNWLKRAWCSSARYEGAGGVRRVRSREDVAGASWKDFLNAADLADAEGEAGAQPEFVVLESGASGASGASGGALCEGALDALTGCRQAWDDDDAFMGYACLQES